MKITVSALCLVALLAALPAAAQVDLSRYVALGDSVTAGFVSGSLLDWYQDRSYPALLAQQAGAATFEQPLVSQPGIPAILELVSLQGPIIQPVSLETGFPYNAEYPLPYNNLGVPGATLFDMIFTTGDINNLVLGNTDNVMHDLVLRNGVNTALEQAIGLQPTFVTVWIGNNDVLAAALSGTAADGITMTPLEAFAGLYGNAIGALVTNTAADIVLINIPYVTEIPFTTTVGPFVDVPGVGTIPLTADTGPLGPNDLVTLPAGTLIQLGYGLPGGPPLPDDLDLLTGEPGYVLRAAEVEAINNRIDAYNQVIADTASAFDLPVLDINARFHEIAGGTRWILGGVEISSDFLIGGLFSYDGIHPQHIGAALVAVELIDLINQTFGASIPQVNMGEVVFEGDWQSKSFRPSAKASEVVMSTEAFHQLYELLGPKVERTPRLRRPAEPSTPGLVKPDLRRIPLPRR